MIESTKKPSWKRVEENVHQFVNDVLKIAFSSLQ